MTYVDTLIERNAAFAENGFSADLKIIPTRKTLILGCVDPRVDPMEVLQLEPGEAAIIRNVGGRVDPALLQTLDILRTVARAGGGEIGAGWNLVVLQHTQCGISGCYHNAPGLLAKSMGVAEADLASLEIDDPRKAVAIDVAALRADPDLPAALTVSGLVYDVTTGRIETVVTPGPLRAG